MSRWFRSAAKVEVPALVAVDEENNLKAVEQALLLLLNDDVKEANKRLLEKDSAYHHLGRGISSFMASMLGAEKELLKDAAAKLQLAETKTWEDMKRAEKDPAAFRSKIYPPGTEYLLCYSIAQLTSAITAVLSGSISEAIKGFYKMRKAFLTLDGIMQVETRYLKRMQNGSRSTLVSRDGSDGNTRTSKSTPLSTRENRNHTSHGITDSELSPRLAALDISIPPEHEQDAIPNLIIQEHNTIEPEMAAEIFTQYTDIFIYSGTHLCYGILLLVLSMVENPVFSKILYIVGFKGDRQRGAQLLWQATSFTNFNSAIAGISLLAFYNGLIGACDILPTHPGADEDISGYPKAKCRELLIRMRKLHPDNKFWKLEEARMHSYNRNLPAALALIKENCENVENGLKQMAIINMFEKSLVTMATHGYLETAESWLACSDLSQWSPALYAYMVGISYVELYRNHRLTDDALAKKHKDKATEYLKKGPPLAGKQKVMGKQLPFDVYVVRKMQKWEERAKAWNVDLVDAIGVSPYTEMVFFWNGIQRSATEQLEKCLAALEWDRTSHPEKHQDNLDERAIAMVLTASVYRNMGKYEEARKLVQEEILVHDKTKFKGPLKDDWSLPSAYYEMACLAWREKDLDGVDEKAKVLECEEWLKKTENVDPYVLETRMSFKIKTSQLTLRKHKAYLGM
ncbi:outer membrane protein-like protein iml2 [Xylogone sp. PMI_703]|nr:outer membrane protein-like protein iml2 [Xylogone sp. PMI_703]